MKQQKSILEADPPLLRPERVANTARNGALNVDDANWILCTSVPGSLTARFLTFHSIGSAEKGQSRTSPGTRVDIYVYALLCFCISVQKRWTSSVAASLAGIDRSWWGCELSDKAGMAARTSFLVSKFVPAVLRRRIRQFIFRYESLCLRESVHDVLLNDAWKTVNNEEFTRSWNRSKWTLHERGRNWE